MQDEFKIFIPFEKKDKDKRLVYGYASTEALDSQGEVVKKEAIEEALPDYMKFGNIREMHQHSAVGKAVSATVDEKGLFLGSKIVDDNAWKKVKEGVYAGYSIGGKIVEKIQNEIHKLKLTEISLVDRPANPEAVFTLVKRDKSGDLVDVQKNFSMARELATLGSALEMFMEYCKGCGIKTKPMVKALEQLKVAFAEVVAYEIKLPEATAEVNGQDGPMMMVELVEKLAEMKFDNPKADAIRKEVIRMANKKDELVKKGKEEEEVVEEEEVTETEEEDTEEETVEEENVEETEAEEAEEEATEETPASESTEEGTPEAEAEESAEAETETPSDVVVDEAVQTADQPSDVTKGKQISIDAELFLKVVDRLEAISKALETKKSEDGDEEDTTEEVAVEVAEETEAEEASTEENSTESDEATEDVAKVEGDIAKLEDVVAKALDPVKEQITKMEARIEEIAKTPAQVKVKAVAVEKGFAEGETKTPDEARLDEIEKRLGELNKIRESNLEDYQRGGFMAEAISLTTEKDNLKSRLGI